jgi:hypothetical protein
MASIALAARCGITSSALQDLINGRVPIGLTAKIPSTSQSLQDFVDGRTSIALAGVLGMTSSDLQQVRNAIGKQGAIGLLIGIASGR